MPPAEGSDARRTPAPRHGYVDVCLRLRDSVVCKCLAAPALTSALLGQDMPPARMSAEDAKVAGELFRLLHARRGPVKLLCCLERGTKDKPLLTRLGLYRTRARGDVEASEDAREVEGARRVEEVV